ncbi:hypothetical protein HSBAA_03670 [Vreelandella sulfidaeris]|uniref:GS beta-grasp domain-containing protein n=1 Tax=Vreelandella sulfidaeris TaxID=115553 RepID=A0A455U3K2_9GAMM|nr:hypothetical protein HSBAA_03670 [Halomonas sulfidaeris]
MSAKTLALIEEHDVKWVDLRFTDTRGKEQHVTVPARDVNEEFLRMAKCLMALLLKAGRVLTNQT